MNEQDPWDRIHDADRDEYHGVKHGKRYVRLPETPQSHDTPRQKGFAPIALILVGLAVIGGAIGWFAYNFLNQWLQLP